ncbi:MAG TPA: type II toxin-antitoxin system RelE/ParE family toxin [Rhizobiaceae bacterium]|nr:type II toxin-antitoxin system RelE/ParE family toxin [Rhizobiaceae bacterium]
MSVIANFRNRALKRYWTKGDESGIRPDWRRKVRLILSRLDVAASPQEMDSPGFGFHALTGDQAGRFAVLVSRNWRLTFGWDGENAIEVDLEDYHGN